MSPTQPETAIDQSQRADFTDVTGAAVVTGGTGGIGREICRLLGERGSRVVMTYRGSGDRAADLVAQAPESFHAVKLDLSDADAGQQLLDAARDRFGAVHTFIHAAGPVVPQIYLSQLEPVQFERHLLAETQGFFNVAHALLPALRDTAGSIVAVTTVANRRYPVRDALSSGPKAAVEAVVRAIAAEEGRYGVRANCVGPGILGEGMTEQLIADGDMSERALAAARERIPLGRLGKAVDVAETVCFLASPRATYITGQFIDVDGGYGI